MTSSRNNQVRRELHISIVEWPHWSSANKVVGLGRFELPTLGLGNQCSIHLSYSPARYGLILTRNGNQRIVSAPTDLHSLDELLLCNFTNQALIKEIFHQSWPSCAHEVLAWQLAYDRRHFQLRVRDLLHYNRSVGCAQRLQGVQAMKAISQNQASAHAVNVDC